MFYQVSTDAEEFMDSVINGRRQYHITVLESSAHISAFTTGQTKDIVITSIL